MAHNESLRKYSFPVAANEALQQYKFGAVNASGQFAVCTASTQAPDGILQDDPGTTGFLSSIGYCGISKVLVGAAGITVGDEGMTDTTGAVTTQTAANLGTGRALYTGVSGDIIPFLLKLRNKV